MFKDYDKYLSVSLKVYIFVLVIVFIMKIVGLDYFGLEVDNPTLIKISNYISKGHLGDIYNFTCVYLQFYFYLCLVCNKKKLYKEAFIGSLLNFIPQCLLFVFYKLNWIYYVYNFLLMIVIPMIINKNKSIKKQIKYILLLTLYQSISLIIRNFSVHYEYYGNFLVDSLLNIDQLLMMAITYNIYFMGGGFKLCGAELEVGLFSLKKINLKNLLKTLQRNLHNFKQLPKVERLTIIIYLFFSLIWNIFTVAFVLFVATLNDTFIECIFILTSFWLSKGKFGKAFHLSSMTKCFVVSNISYYVLNRITTPLGISILVPIMLGVALSYVTSKLVKKTYKPLYRGMSKETFEETILKIVDKDSLKYKICYDFYINKKSDLSLSMKYNYSVVGIRKIKSRINDKIKEL